MFLLALAIWLTPAHAALSQAILLGPDSLLPQQAPSFVMVTEPGPRGPHPVRVPIRPGTILQGQIISAALHGRRQPYIIYLPPGYADPANAHRHYPVLYLLHGSPGQPRDWLSGAHIDLLADRQIALGQIPPLILVMPEGNGGVLHDSQYVDGTDGFAAETYLTHDVVRYIDAHYRTIADRAGRGLMGISEGGYGAVNLALKHHDEFSVAASISGYFLADPAEVFIGNDPWRHNWALMAANSPLRYVQRRHGPRDVALLIADNPNDGKDYAEARAFDRLLTRLGIPHRLLIQPAPLLLGHYWPYWHEAIPPALTFCGQHLAWPRIGP